MLRVFHSTVWDIGVILARQGTSGYVSIYRVDKLDEIKLGPWQRPASDSSFSICHYRVSGRRPWRAKRRNSLDRVDVLYLV